jgi:hypothetical protein
LPALPRFVHEADYEGDVILLPACYYKKWSLVYLERKYKMNHRLVCLPLCLLAILLLTGCQSKDQPLIPVTGAENESISALTELARNNVLEYVISSSRVANAPPSSAEWQLDDGQQLNGEYRFRSGDWTMLVWPADANEENQRVMIINKIEKVAWCGYVAPDGHVVDTAYYR